MRNCIYCSFTFTFPVELFLKKHFLHTVMRYQVFLSNTNNYKAFSNYFGLIFVIHLQTQVKFQVTNNNP